MTTLDPQHQSRLQSIKSRISQSLEMYKEYWRELSIGVYIRIFSLILILIIASLNPLFPDINDMNQLITIGLSYMFQGLCPYQRPYLLSALGANPRDWYIQNYMNYGPVNLILHVPCMLYPWSFDFAGFMDFQPSFMVWHGFFDFLIFDRLLRMKHRVAAFIIWANPIMVTMDLVTHMSVPIFLLLMGYEKWNDPVKSVFWLGLGALTYQYIALLLLFVTAYHIRSYKQVLLGILPSLFILGIFQAWATIEGRPSALFNDLLLAQFGRSYEPWFPNHIYSWYTWTGSIPALVFNVYNIVFNPSLPSSLWVDPVEILTGFRFSTLMNGFALGTSIILLAYLVLRPDYKRSLKFSFISMLLFLLASPSGIWHHNFILLVPVFFMAKEIHILLWRKKKITKTLTRNQSSQEAQNT
ncbi:MAG: hypothetical protein ACFFDP_00105 [Promethearchaeota archaeon]